VTRPWVASYDRIDAPPGRFEGIKLRKVLVSLKPKLYQIRVSKRGKRSHNSETDRQTTGRNRVKRETLKLGPGAHGVLYRVDRKHGDALVPVYEVRCVHEGKQGRAALAVEDHETPPTLPEE